MIKKSAWLVGLSLVLTACSPRDFLTRRLASDLISAAPSFKAAQQFLVQTGIVASNVYPSPEFLVLQHRGWINASNAACPAGIVPPPCWDLALTPSGVDAVRTLISAEDATKPSFSISIAKRELLGITGISKDGNRADVEFSWRWMPLNEVGAALYSSDVRYQSTAGFRKYDDGWRVLEGSARQQQTLEDALKNSEPAR